MIKNYSKIFWLVSLFLVIKIPTSYATEFTGTQNSFKSIKASYQAQEYQQTVIKATNYLKLYPKDTDVLLYLGYAYYNLKDYDNTIATFENLINRNPKYLDAWVLLAQAYRNKNENVQADNVIKNGLKYFPDNSELLAKQIPTITPAIPATTNPTIAQAINPPVEVSNPLLVSKQPQLENTTVSLLSNEKSPIVALAEKEKIQLPTEEQILSLYHAQKYPEVINLAKQYLQKYPKDVDISNLLALAYLKTKQYNLAAQLFSTMLAQDPSNIDLRKKLINAYFSQENYAAVIKTADAGLQTGESLETWQLEKAKAYYSLADFKNTVMTLSKIQQLDQYPDAQKLYEAVNEETQYRYTPHNEFGAYNSLIHISNPNQYWNIATLYGTRNNFYGAFGGFVNYQNRPAATGYQGGLTAQPKLTKTTFLASSYAYSDQPALFPNQYIYAELFQYLPLDFQVSGGNTYRKIENTYLNAYTGSLTKFIGRYQATIQPTRFIPKAGPTSTMCNFNLIRYGDNPDKYLSLVYAVGQSPDLDDLASVDFFKINDSIYMINGQQPMSGKFLVQYGFGFEHQEFPHNKVRELLYFNLGIKLREVA